MPIETVTTIPEEWGRIMSNQQKHQSTRLLTLKNLIKKL